MNKHFQTKFAGDSNSYSFGLEWDDSKFEEGEIEYTISIKRESLLAEGKEIYQVKVSLKRDENNSDDDPSPPRLIVDYLKNTEFVKELVNIRFDEDFVSEKVVEEAIKSISESLWGPVIGCLIGSGLGVTIDQLLECRNNTRDIKPWFWLRMKRLGNCLKHSFPGMCIKLAYHAVECMIGRG